jgi:PAS domain S-box-containing protein
MSTKTICKVMATIIRVLYVDTRANLAADTPLERDSDGMRIETATSASEGLDYLAEHDIDCVVSGYDLPDRTGVEFLEAVRGEYPELPVLLYTATGSEAIASDAISAGVTDYVRKGRDANGTASVTDRIRAAVDRSRARSRSNSWADAIETASDGVAIIDEDGRYAAVNEAYAAAYGTEPVALIGEPWTDTVPAEDVAQLRAEGLPAVGGSDSDGESAAGQPIDGGSTPNLHPVASLRNGGVVCVVRDDTDRNEREAHTRRTASRLHALFKHSPDMIDVHDADGRILDVNERFCEVLGHSEDALVGTHVWDIDQHLEPAELRDIWDRTAVGERLRFETEYRRADGSTFPVEVHVVRLDIDREDRFVAISRDISDRKEREAEFRRKTRAMDEAPVGITISESAQKDNEMTYINEKFEEMTGYTKAEAVGENCRFLQGAETREEPVAEMRSAIDNEEPVSVELRNYRKDGTMFWNRVTIAPVEDETGEITNWVGFQEDITDRKEGEQKLRRQNDQLEEFASVVSHDLRNPLNVAEGRLELLREECESDYIEDIAWAHQRMNDLIDDLLTLAREGDRIRHLERVDLAAVIRDCWRNVETTRATISSDITRPIRADRRRLQQLLENLMRNAIEHAGEDVAVTIGELDDGFYVADDGPGIPESERDRVFDAGYSTSTDGTGFGLSIVEQIVDAHDWEIEVTENATGGTRFEIRNVTFAGE